MRKKLIILLAAFATIVLMWAPIAGAAACQDCHQKMDGAITADTNTGNPQGTLSGLNVMETAAAPSVLTDFKIAEQNPEFILNHDLITLRPADTATGSAIPFKEAINNTNIEIDGLICILYTATTKGQFPLRNGKIDAVAVLMVSGFGNGGAGGYDYTGG